MEMLERDFSEGKQKNQTQVAWRKISNRNAIRDRKIVIYAALAAQHAGNDVKHYMNGLQQQAELAMKKATGPGNTANVMNHIKTKVEALPGFLSPTEFEKQILGWKHTPQILAQAKSKQARESAPYPPTGIPFQS